MGESENSESDFIRVITALFKDDIEDAIKKVYKNRIAPTVRKTVSDSLKDLIDQLFHTTSTVQSGVPAGSVVTGQQKTDYTKSFITGTVPASTVKALPVTTSVNTAKAAVSNSNFNGLPNYVTLASREDAQNVVNVMNDKIREDGEASVNDLFDFAGKSNIISGSSVAPRYGWYNIDGCAINEMADGQWMLSMPPYCYLKKEN